MNINYDKYYNILANYNKDINIESRIESTIEVNVNQLIGNGGKEDRRQVFHHCYSGWYLGDMKGEHYYSSTIFNEKQNLEEYKERLLSFEKKPINYLYNPQVSSLLSDKSEMEDSIEQSEIIINEINKGLEKLLKEDFKIKIWIDLLVKRTKKYYFNNLGCCIDLGDDELIYIELAIKGGRQNINDTLLLSKQNLSITHEIRLWLAMVIKLYNSKFLGLKKKKYPILMSSTATGMIAHEIFGHNYEKDWGNGVAVNNNLNKLEWLNVVDDSYLSGNVLYCYDDSGIKSSQTVIIENGNEKKYLNTNIEKGFITSNSRAQDYRYPPITRMSNTYIKAGHYKEYDLDKNIGECIIIEKLYNNIRLYNNNLYLPIRLAKKIMNNGEEKYIKDTMMKITPKPLSMAKLGNEVKINLLWCSKNGQEVVVGAGGPRIYFDYGVIL